MGLFDFFKDKIPSKNIEPKQIARGTVEVNNVKYLGPAEIKDMQKGFIAIDFETTGLSPVTDEIIEFAAVVFQNGSIVNRFSELAKPSQPISRNVTKITGIDDKMVKKALPTRDVALKFYDFINQYENFPLVSHNAPFDMRFLIATLEPLGISTHINSIDTLSYARQLRPKQESYHLAAAARMFNVEVGETHRAQSDAEMCGKIAVQILKEKDILLEEKRRSLTDFELKIIEIIIDILESNERETAYLSFSKRTYFSADYYYSFLKIKSNAKKPYILVSEICASSLPPERVADCPASEAKDNQKRFYVEQPSDILLIKTFLLESFDAAHKSLEELFDLGDRYQKLAIEHLSAGFVF